MGKVFLITSGKGGVGKSTLASSLAIALSESGHSVLLVDTDIGLRCDDLMLDMQNSIIYDFGDLMENPETENALQQHPVYRGLYLLSAPQMMTAGEVEKKRFRRMIGALKGRFDFVLLDSPAGVGRSLKNTLGCADETIVVCTMDDVSLRDAEKIGQLLSEANEAHPSVVFNKVDKSLIKSGAVPVPEAAALSLDMPLLGVIPFSRSVSRALITHTSAYECDDKWVYREIENIAARMMGQSVPHHKYKASLLTRLRKDRR